VSESVPPRRGTDFDAALPGRLSSRALRCRRFGLLLVAFVGWWQLRRPFRPASHRRGLGSAIVGAMIDEVRRVLLRELEAFAREVESFPDDESLWKTLPGVTNSAGNLALHACGNLKHFVGAVLGGTGYIRQRPTEFATRAGRREDVARGLREAAEVVGAVLPHLTTQALDQPFPEAHDGTQLPCGRFLLHLVTHLCFHLGQASYLRRILTGDSHPSSAVSLEALAGD